MRIRFTVMLTLLLALAVLPSISYGQIVQGAKVNDTVTNCIITTPTAANTIKTTYVAANAQGQQCITIVPSKNNDGIAVNGVTTNSTAGSAQVTSIVNTAGQIYGLTVDAGANTANTVVWINFFNAAVASVNPGTTGALFSISTAAATGTLGNQTPMPWGNPVGIPFTTALTVNCTTTKNGATGCGSPANIIALTK